MADPYDLSAWNGRSFDMEGMSADQRLDLFLDLANHDVDVSMAYASSADAVIARLAKWQKEHDVVTIKKDALPEDLRTALLDVMEHVNPRKSITIRRHLFDDNFKKFKTLVAEHSGGTRAEASPATETEDEKGSLAFLYNNMVTRGFLDATKWAAIKEPLRQWDRFMNDISNASSIEALGDKVMTDLFFLPVNVIIDALNDTSSAIDKWTEQVYAKIKADKEAKRAETPAVDPKEEAELAAARLVFGGHSAAASATTGIRDGVLRYVKEFEPELWAEYERDSAAFAEHPELKTKWGKIFWGKLPNAMAKYKSVYDLVMNAAMFPDPIKQQLDEKAHSVGLEHSEVRHDDDRVATPPPGRGGSHGSDGRGGHDSSSAAGDPDSPGGSDGSDHSGIPDASAAVSGADDTGSGSGSPSDPAEHAATDKSDDDVLPETPAAPSDAPGTPPPPSEAAGIVSGAPATEASTPSDAPGTPPSSETATVTPEAPAVETPAPGDGPTPPPSEAAGIVSGAPTAEASTPGDASATPPPSESDEVKTAREALETAKTKFLESISSAPENTEALAGEVVNAAGNLAQIDSTIKTRITEDEAKKAIQKFIEKMYSTIDPDHATGKDSGPNITKLSDDDRKELADILANCGFAQALYPTVSREEALAAEKEAQERLAAKQAASEVKTETNATDEIKTGATGENPVGVPRPDTEDRTPTEASSSVADTTTPVAGKVKPGKYEYPNPVEDLKDGREFKEPYVLTVDNNGHRWYTKQASDSNSLISWVEIPLEGDKNSYLHISSDATAYVIQDGKIAASVFRSSGQIDIFEYTSNLDNVSKIQNANNYFAELSTGSTSHEIKEFPLDAKMDSLDLIASQLKRQTLLAENMLLQKKIDDLNEQGQDGLDKEQAIRSQRDDLESKIADCTEKIRQKMEELSESKENRTLFQKIDIVQTVIKNLQNMPMNPEYCCGDDRQLLTSSYCDNHTNQLSDMLGEKKQGLFSNKKQNRSLISTQATLRLFKDTTATITFHDGIFDPMLFKISVMADTTLSDTPRHLIQKRYDDGSGESFLASPTSFEFTTWANWDKQQNCTTYSVDKLDGDQFAVTKVIYKNNRPTTYRVINQDGSWVDYSATILESGILHHDDKPLHQGKDDSHKAQYDALVSAAKWHMEHRAEQLKEHKNSSLLIPTAIRIADIGQAKQNDRLNKLNCLTDEAYTSIPEVRKVEQQLLSQQPQELIDLHEERKNLEQQYADCGSQLTDVRLDRLKKVVSPLHEVSQERDENQQKADAIGAKLAESGWTSTEIPKKSLDFVFDVGKKTLGIVNEEDEQKNKKGQKLSATAEASDENDDTNILSPGEPAADDTIEFSREELEQAKKAYERNSAAAQTPVEQSAPEQPKIDLKNATYDELNSYLADLQKRHDERFGSSLFAGRETGTTIYDAMGNKVYISIDKNNTITQASIPDNNESLTSDKKVKGIAISRTTNGGILFSSALLKLRDGNFADVTPLELSTYDSEGKPQEKIVWHDDKSDARTVTKFGSDGKQTSVEEYDADGKLIKPENTESVEQPKPEPVEKPAVAKTSAEQPVPEQPKIDLKNATYDELNSYLADLQKRHDERFGSSLFAGRETGTTIYDAMGNKVYISIDKNNTITQASIPDNNESLTSDKKVKGIAISRTQNGGIIFSSALLKLRDGNFADVTPLELSTYDSDGKPQEKIVWHDDKSDARTVTKFGSDGKQTSVEEYDADGKLIKPENTKSVEQPKPEPVEKPAVAKTPAEQPAEQNHVEPAPAPAPAPSNNPSTPAQASEENDPWKVGGIVTTRSGVYTIDKIGQGMFVTHSEEKQETDGKHHTLTFDQNFSKGIKTITDIYDDNHEQHFICVNADTRRKTECNLCGEPGHQRGILLSVSDNQGIIKHRIVDGKVVSQEHMDRYTGHKTLTRLYKPIPLPDGLHAMNIEELSEDLQKQFKKLNSKTIPSYTPNQASKWKQIHETTSNEIFALTDLMEKRQFDQQQKNTKMAAQKNNDSQH